MFLMRVEGQSFEDYQKAFIESLRAKGMLTEKKQLDVPNNKGGIANQEIQGETDGKTSEKDVDSGILLRNEAGSNFDKGLI